MNWIPTSSVPRNARPWLVAWIGTVALGLALALRDGPLTGDPVIDVVFSATGLILAIWFGRSVYTHLRHRAREEAR
jgi:hypothetical protein